MGRPSFPAKLPVGHGNANANASSVGRSVNPQNTTKKIADNVISASGNIVFSLPTSANSNQSMASAKPKLMAASSGIGLESQAVRRRMVDKLAAQGISEAAVLQAMLAVERHRFVDTALVGQAYEDTSLPIGLEQTISKPNVVARMLELLLQGAALSATTGAKRTGRVLEIGTGCGYQAAVLAQLCSEVYSIERLRGLHDKARENLRAFKIAHLHLLLGDGMLGYAPGAPYVGIIAAAGGNAIPPAWVQQLAMGGRIVAPMVTSSGGQALVVIDKTQQGVTQTVLEAVHFVPLKSGVM